MPAYTGKTLVTLQHVIAATLTKT